MYFLYNAGEYEIVVLRGETELDVDNDNVDVEVRFHNGPRYGATFFTLRNIQLLFEKNKRTGECGQGTYLYATDMIVVEKLNYAIIIETVSDLIIQGELQHAFLLLSSTTEPEKTFELPQ